MRAVVFTKEKSKGASSDSSFKGWEGAVEGLTVGFLSKYCVYLVCFESYERFVNCFHAFFPERNYKGRNIPRKKNLFSGMWKKKYGLNCRIS